MPCGTASSGEGRGIGCQLVVMDCCTQAPRDIKAGDVRASAASATLGSFLASPFMGYELSHLATESNPFKARASCAYCRVLAAGIVHAASEIARRRGALLRNPRQGAAALPGAGPGRRWSVLDRTRGRARPELHHRGPRSSWHRPQHALADRL